MDRQLRGLIRHRARGHCEYCGFPEAFSQRPFHSDHVIAQQHGGATEAANLAWACYHCNLHKGPNLTSVDPETRETTRLFNPRSDSWDQHFEWRGAFLIGRSPIGRATVFLLRLNEPMVIATRAALMDEGVYVERRQ